MKRKPTRSEATAKAFTIILSALDVYYCHQLISLDDTDRLLAAVIAHRKRLPIKVTLDGQS